MAAAKAKAKATKSGAVKGKKKKKDAAVAECSDEDSSLKEGFKTQEEGPSQEEILIGDKNSPPLPLKLS